MEFISNTKVAMAKLTKDVEKLVENSRDNKEEHRVIMQKIDHFIECADKKYADKEVFVFWRNLVVTGIMLSIFIGLISLFLERISG